MINKKGFRERERSRFKGLVVPLIETYDLW